MLSVEKPPPDPPCPCKSPQVNSSSDEERDSHKQQQQQQQQQLPLPEVVVVDLPNPPSLDHHTPLPNFSIRDYVFTARSKDIKNNWPFSLKNLNLCLKHGVKDVLPPFQSLDTVRNQSLKRCAVETSSLEKQNTSNFDKEPCKPDGHVVLDTSDDARLNNKLAAESCLDISSCRSGEENDFPSTTTSVSQSEIESSVPDSRPLKLKTKTLLNASVEVEAKSPPVSHKTENTYRPTGKKCRLIVKFGGNSDRTSTEDIASNCTTVSETMGSKVCPVCKTFSSSSNTTLNAHIDQCLSVESTPKWTADSRLTRHRIKPRKTRLMVDIYVTALHCTLEDLDRRNGTSWATVSTLPTQETEKVETSNELKKQRMAPVHSEDGGDVGPVYIDASGTKVRILSKFNDPSPVSKTGDDNALKKPLKGGKGSKYILKKKKKRLSQKHQKYLKLASRSKKLFSRKVHGYQINGGGEGYDCEEESGDKEQSTPKQIKHNDAGTLGPWVCSKRRGFTKKITGQDGQQPVRCKWQLPQDLLVEKDPPFLSHSLKERNRVQKFTNLSEKLLSSPGIKARMDKQFHRTKGSHKREKSLGRKKTDNVVGVARIKDNVERSSLPSKQNANQLSKDGRFGPDSDMLTPPNPTRDDSSSLSKKAFDTNRTAAPIPSIKSSHSCHAIVTKAMRFSSFRKNLLSVSSGSSVSESRPSKIKNWSPLEKSSGRILTKRDEEVVACQSEVDQEYTLLDDHNVNQFEFEELTDEASLQRSNILGTRQERGLVCREESLVFRSSSSAPHSYDQDEGVNMEASGGLGDDLQDKNDFMESSANQVPACSEDIMTEQSLKMSDWRGTASLSKSVETELYKLSSSSKDLSSSLPSMEDYRGLLCGTGAPTGPTEPDFANDQEMFSADEVSGGMLMQNADLRVELDSEAVQGNSFAEVDPIPIPGPPGSFLPSPRDMGSEDFQGGNSSLTTSRVHSSPDHRDAVDGGSSDSPISATSTISNSTTGGPDFKYSEPSPSVGNYAVEAKITSSGSVANPVELSGQNAGAVPGAASLGTERITFDGDFLKLNRIPIEKGSLSFKNDQPCCCQRKERFSHGVALNHQESQLLRRRKMAPVSVPVVEQPIGCYPNTRPVLPSGGSTSGSEKMVIPVISTPPGPVPCKDSPNAGERLLARTDGDTASLSTSNPVLRLMGKNLVVNKDADAPLPAGQVQPSAHSNPQTPQYPTFSSVSPGNIQNQDSNSLYHVFPQGSAIFGRDQSTVGPCFDVGLSNGLDCLSNSSFPAAPARFPVGMVRDQLSDGGFATSMANMGGDYYIPSQHNGLKNRKSASAICNMERVSTPDGQGKYNDPSTRPPKEIIILDDVPRHGSVGITNVTKYTESWREGQVVSSGISISAAPSFSLGHAHPLSYYQFQDHSPHAESPVLHNVSFHAPPTRVASTNSVRWGCTTERTGALHRSPLAAASPSNGHLRSTELYYSPGYS